MPAVAVSCRLPTATSTVRALATAVDVAVTVTVLAPPFSVTLAGLADSVTSGAASSSVSVRVVPVSFALTPSTFPATAIVSSPSASVSWVGVRVNVPVALVAFLARVMSKFDTAA